MSGLKKQWWWLYSLISGVAMAFFISALLVVMRGSRLEVPTVDARIWITGALSSAFFYLLLRWPNQHRKSAYRFSVLYMMVLTSLAYIIQCYQYGQRQGEYFTVHGLLIVSALMVGFAYSPSSFLPTNQVGLRNHYMTKSFAVAWSWSIWASMPLLFLKTYFIYQVLLIAFFMILSLVIITDIIDMGDDQSVSTWISRLGVKRGLLLVFFFCLLAEVGIHFLVGGRWPYGLVMASVAVPVGSLKLNRPLLSSFLVDFALIIFFASVFWLEWTGSLP